MVPGSVRIYVAAEAVDLRRGFDGLAASTRSLLQEDPLSGHVFVFLNARRDRVKILAWDRSGWVIYYKRIEVGRFHLPRPTPGQRRIELDAGDLALLLEGVDLQAVPRRARWQRSEPALLSQASV
jgi:transposase